MVLIVVLSSLSLKIWLRIRTLSELTFSVISSTVEWKLFNISLNNLKGAVILEKKVNWLKEFFNIVGINNTYEFGNSSGMTIWVIFSYSNMEMEWFFVVSDLQWNLKSILDSEPSNLISQLLILCKLLNIFRHGLIDILQWLSI